MADFFKKRTPPPRKPDFIDDLFHMAATRITEPVGNARIVTCPQGILTYRLLPKTVGEGVGHAFAMLRTELHEENTGKVKPDFPLDVKIREMFAANPSIDFKNYEESLHIKVIRQEYKRSSHGSIQIEE